MRRGRQDERRDLGFGEKSEATWGHGPWAMGRAGSLSLGAASSLLGREQGQGVAGGSEEGLTLALAASRSPSSSYEASTSSVCLHLCTVMIKYITMSSPSMRLGQKMEDGQWSSRPRQTPLFLGQPSPLQPCGTVLYLYTSIPKKQNQLCIIPRSSGLGTTRTGRLMRALASRVCQWSKQLQSSP
jgi:hypothetical protein